MSADADVLRMAASWRTAGKGVAPATVVRTWSPAPREAGSHMAVNEDGVFCGSVSGGCVEGAVVEAATAPEEPAGPEPATAMDPVCKMTVDVKGALHTFEHEGTVDYFCCGGCRTRFAESPEQYRAVS